MPISRSTASVSSPKVGARRRIAPGVGPALPVAADAQHHEARVRAAQLVVAEAPAFHHTGLEVLDQHIAFGDQPAHDLARFGLPQVQRDAAFVA